MWHSPTLEGQKGQIRQEREGHPALRAQPCPASSEKAKAWSLQEREAIARCGGEGLAQRQGEICPPTGAWFKYLLYMELGI